MKNKIKIIIVDDNDAFLEGIASFIRKNNKFEIIGQLSSGIDLLSYPKLGQSELILMDIEMPVMNGIETAKRVNFIFPYIKFIAITMYQDIVYLKELIEAGFRGFVNKTSVTNELFPAIDKILENNFVFPADISILRHI